MERKKTKIKKRKARGSEDTRSRRKYARGKRIEAYTLGETKRSKDWPY